MGFRLTGILALVAAFLGLLILLWDEDDDTTRARLEQARRAFRFDPARVDRLVIEMEDLAIECRLEGAQWHLVRPLAARADPTAIERLLDALQELPRGDIILPASRRGDDAYAPYGLDAPRARLSLVEGAATNRILIGRRTPLGDGVYVRQSDHAGLARLDPALLDLLPTSAADLRDRALLAGTPASIDRLDIRGPAGYMQLARNGHGGWRIYQPVSARADSAILAALIEKLLSCSVVQFVQDAASDLSPYGLDSRTAVTAVLNTAGGDGSQMISFGDPLPNDPALVYARLQGENSVCAVPLEVRQALLVKPDDLRDRRIPGLDPASVRAVRIEEAESVLEFQRGPDETWRIVAPLRAPADADAVLAQLRAWNDVRLSAFEPPSDPAAAWTRTIRIAGDDSNSPPVILRLAPQPGDAASARIFLEGDSVGALAPRAALLDFPLDPLPFRAREILSVPADDVAGVRFTAPGQAFQAERDPATGQWMPAAPWLDGLLSALAPLRADSLVSEEGAACPGAGFDAPVLAIEIRLRGQSGLSTTLLVGAEVSPGGPRYALVRGRDLVFTLSPWTVAALTPPPPKEAE